MTNITNAMLNHYNQLTARAEAETLQNCIARAEAAEAEVARLRVERDSWIKSSDIANAEAARLRKAYAEMYETLVRISDGDEGDPSWTANRCLERVDNSGQDAAGG